MRQVTFHNAGEGGRMPGHKGLELLIQAADGGVHILPRANTCRQQKTKAEPSTSATPSACLAPTA